MTMLIRSRISPDEWKPVGIIGLEANADEVVRSVNNRSVIAGPGSGKTELLAQRASFLLQCGVCKPPRRILAISFKRDAASNLAKRVHSRCHETQAYRFDSLTFDSFSKSLVDRFGQALPSLWRPAPDYEIVFPGDRDYRSFLQGLTPPSAVGSKADIMAITVKEFERRWLLDSPLDGTPKPNPTPEEWAAEQFWQQSLRGRARSFLSFPMIGRLAVLLLQTNPMARQALRLTYSHLFMDEFQDTTQIQYDLAKAIFLGSDTVVTAVGDNKQQIMRWAMAMDDPFAAFEADFGAQRTPLLNNYRSSPDVVRIQDVLAKALDAKASTPVSQSQGTIAGDSCVVLDFSSPDKEAAYLADFVKKQMTEYKLKPRDFSVLVRQKAPDYMAKLQPAFAAQGLTLRNEAAQVGSIALQELLAEDVSEILVILLRTLTNARAGRHWSECLDSVCSLQGLAPDDEAAHARFAKALDAYCADFLRRFPNPPQSRALSQAVIDALLDFLGRRNLTSLSPAYRQGDWFDKVIAGTSLHLEASSLGAPDWAVALDMYEGAHAVPLMTIHKSKGLEYHTVIFVGLDDGAWWSFANDAVEATAGFFVAFTRAKQRVLFSYCPSRGDRKKIAVLYGFLSAAGVKTSAMG
jgi:superfamily I DNA/RNA helicase